jgi:hypothetical protein
MSNPRSLSSSSVGRLTGIVLGTVVFLCVTLIGFSGYVKYQLDRAETVLGAPDAALPVGEDAFNKLRRALGYSGFVGTAQTFLATHDHAAIDDMNAQIKTAEDLLSRLPDKTPPETRHDLQSIVDIFANAAHKAEQSVTDVSVGFTPADMGPLYAALPVLDQRVENGSAVSRFGAENDLKLWATLLTLIAWISLITAAGCTAGIYMSLRERHGAPLRALAQSVQNMARGDMRTPIWGMERHDMVGDLARAVDLARYHFSQLPDMSLLSEQGPVRIRFEGQARSLFEAMMQNIARDSEGIRAQAVTLGDAVSRQKEAVAAVSQRIEAALGNIYHERQSGEQQVQQLLQSVAGSAQNLRSTQETTVAQLDQLISYLEERAKGMAEVTQIAGKQVAQTLQSLSLTEHSLRASAAQNQQTVQKLAASTDELGERLFGAVSLLRAGGKVLTETAEQTQGRLNEAISLLSQSEASLRQILVQGFEPVGRALIRPPDQMSHDPLARDEKTDHLRSIVIGLEVAQRKLEECLAHQAEATEAQINLLTAHSNSLLTQASATAQTLASVTDNLREEQGRLGKSIAQSGDKLATTLESIGGRFEQRIVESIGRVENAAQGFSRLSDLTGQLGPLIERLSTFQMPVVIAPEKSASGEATTEASGQLLTELKMGFELTTRSLERLREEFIANALRQPAASSSAEAPAASAAPMPDLQGQWSKIVEQIMAANDTLSKVVTQQTDRIETRLTVMDKKIAAATASGPAAPPSDEAQTQLKQQAQILAELATALSAIDAHMQEMESVIRSQRSEDRNHNFRDAV